MSSNPNDRPVRPDLVPLLRQFCEAMQQVIYAGADVKAEVKGKPATILNTDVASTLGIKVRYITSESPEEQETIIPAFTPFSVSFTDV